jgi:hypothetical protein
VKLISALHTAKIAETARENWKGEKMKKLKIIKTNKFMQYMDRADKILHYYPCCRKNCEMDIEICVPYATYGCPKQFHIIQTIHNKPTFKGQRLSFQGPHN